MGGKYPFVPPMSSLSEIRRPLRDLMVLLPGLPITDTGQPDYAEAGADFLVRLAESAELALQIVHEGFSAIGLLQSHTAQQIEGGDIKAAHAAALGRLLTELGEVLLFVHGLSVECRRYTADYVGNGAGDGG